MPCAGFISAKTLAITVSMIAVDTSISMSEKPASSTNVERSMPRQLRRRCRVRPHLVPTCKQLHEHDLRAARAATTTARAVREGRCVTAGNAEGFGAHPG